MILREIKNMYTPVQRIEYLEVGNTANSYIDTGILPSNSISIVAQIQVLDNYKGFLFDGGNDTMSAELGFILKGDSNERSFRYGSENIALTQSTTYPSEPFIISSLDNPRILVVNGTKSGSAASHTFSSQNSIYLFGLHRNKNNSGSAKNCRVYYFKMYNSGTLVRDFIPVRIGTKGYMYDKVSGRLFGNKGTGDFILGQDVGYIDYSRNLQQIYQNKLIEGVDYETADWLKADIPINTSMMSLPINSKNFEFKRNWIQIMNSVYFITSSSNNTYMYYISNLGDRYDLQPRIWDGEGSRTVYESSLNLGLGIHTIIANNDEVTISSAVNTATLPWYEGTGINIRFNNSNNTNKNTIHLTSSIKVDGVTRYVPCQLLRSIPRNLDAQCKERVAGECGMIDLISGKFYGNVANSGTFTVENDNE